MPSTLPPSPPAAPAPELFLLQPSFCSMQHSMQPPSSRLPGHPCPKHPVLCCTWPTHPHGGAALSERPT
ncbi:hypothetical protein BKA81DRAFT_351164, partial [Phyllosticta paracitricarpa]